MPDVPARRRHFLEDPDLEPTLKVPAGETSLAAVKRSRYGDPRPRLDPDRKRIRCENPAWSCWREAHETRGDHEYGDLNLCPSCAEAWDAEVADERRLAALEAKADSIRHADEPRDHRTCGAPTPGSAYYDHCVQGRDRCQDPEHVAWREARDAGSKAGRDAGFRREHGIETTTPREAMPSRQDRREEYDRRNEQRRRDRREARRTATSPQADREAVAPTAASATPS